MTEAWTRMDTFKVDAICPKCKGLMKPTGTILTSLPPQYVHRCEKCGFEENLNEMYPKIVHKPIK